MQADQMVMTRCNASMWLAQVWLVISVCLSRLSNAQSSLTSSSGLANGLLVFISYPTIAETGQTYTVGFKSSSSDVRPYLLMPADQYIGQRLLRSIPSASLFGFLELVG